MDERERLEMAFREVLFGEGRSVSELIRALADVAMKAPAPPTPRPVWPGLEGEGLEVASDLGRAAAHAAMKSGCMAKDMDRAYHTAITAHLFRALVAGLPSVNRECWKGSGPVVLVGDTLIPRAALAALADPYDGGGK